MKIWILKLHEMSVWQKNNCRFFVGTEWQIKFAVLRRKKKGGRSRICFSSVYRQEFTSSEKKNIPIASVVVVQTTSVGVHSGSSGSGIRHEIPKAESFNRHDGERLPSTFSSGLISRYITGKLRNVIYVKGAVENKEFRNFTGKFLSFSL